MTQLELEKVIDDRCAKQIEDAKTSIKNEIGSINNTVDEKKLDEAVTKAIKNIQEQNAKDKNSNSAMLLNFEKANAEYEVKGLKKETPASVVNEMIGSALLAMETGKKSNVSQVTNDELLNAAKKAFPHSKALHAVISEKALNTGTNSEGGFTVPVAFSPDYIKALYANTILEKLGVKKVPMANGNLNIPKMTASAAASWIGEATAVTESEPTFGQVSLKAKKLGCLTAVSNSLLRYNAVGIESWVAEDLMMKARIALDNAFLKGTGSSYQPLGLENTTGIQTVGSSSTALAVDTPITMTALLEQANIPMDNVKWLMSPMVKSWLAGKAFSSGPFAWASEMAQSKQINGFDFVASSTVGYDSETPSGDLWIGDFSQLLWGVGYDISVEMSREGSYLDGSGSTVSAFQNDLTLIRLITEHDFACRNASAFVHGTFKQA